MSNIRASSSDDLRFFCGPVWLEQFKYCVSHSVTMFNYMFDKTYCTWVVLVSCSWVFDLLRSERKGSAGWEETFQIKEKSA